MLLGEGEMRGIIARTMITLLLMSMLSVITSVQLATSAHTTIVVPDDYPTIQEAVDAANDTDIIFVRNGTYNENVVIDKSISLVGEDNEYTIVDGSGRSNVISVSSDNVVVTRLRLVNADYAISCDYLDSIQIINNIIVDHTVGIHTWRCSKVTIKGNIFEICSFGGLLMQDSMNGVVEDNLFNYSSNPAHLGIELSGGGDFDVLNNTIIDCSWAGLALYHSTGNVFVQNNLVNNNYSAYFQVDSLQNTFYHNNFVNYSSGVMHPQNNTWDSGVEGNYWSDYTGTDLDGDGIGDTELPWQAADYHPLMNPYVEGDINHDSIVDILDAIILSTAFDSTSSDTHWNPHCDLNQDNWVDIFDAVILASHLGEQWDYP